MSEPQTGIEESHTSAVMATVTAARPQAVAPKPPLPPHHGRAKSSLDQYVRRFASRLLLEYGTDVSRDPKGFKKRVVALLRRNLPPFAGRPTEAAITLAINLRKKGLEWSAIYPSCIPRHASLPPAERQIAESNLRAARRSRRNATKRRKRLLNKTPKQTQA